MCVLTHSLRKGLAKGLEQYLWFWGQDCKVRSANLFVKFGFRRSKPLFQGGSSRYELERNGRLIFLHSRYAGVFGGGLDGFIYIRQFDRAYVYRGNRAPWPGRYRAQRLWLPRAKSDWNRYVEAADPFLKWMEEYELWVCKQMGSEYRRDCYRQYHRPWRSPENALAWFRWFRQGSSHLIQRLSA